MAWLEMGMDTKSKEWEVKGAEGRDFQNDGRALLTVTIERYQLRVSKHKIFESF